MNHSEAYYIHLCKQEIEKKLGWPESSEWRQRDYLKLSDLIEKESGISLSLSTLKRIWKEGFAGTPHPSTLEALAKFLQYADWLDFKGQHQPTNPQQEKRGSEALSSFPKRTHQKKLIIIGFLIMVSVLAVFAFQFQKQTDTSNLPIYDAQQISFSSDNTVAVGVPNTVLFHYDVSQVKADSFFIQQSWNRFRRDKINAYAHTLSSMYYYPGVHQAKLIANDSVIRESTVRVHTNGWLALARYGYADEVPTYIRDSDLIDKGMIAVKEHHLNDNHIDINNDLLISYYWIDTLPPLSSSHFRFETRLRSDSIANVSCPHIGISILGEKDMNFIPLTSPGCVGNATIKMGDAVLRGENNDLSAFGVDVYQWQVVRAEVRNKVAEIFVNDQLLTKIPFAEDIGEIVGFNINFSGTGTIDALSLSSTDKKDTMYVTDFR